MTAPQTASPRLVSLDAFRGATIASMILVNNPGSWSAIYWPLEHAPWHGWTPTDLIFPFFLFVVGISLTLSRRIEPGAALRRALLLAGLGLFMAAFPFFDLSTLRWPGVLQRIAACYLLAFFVRRAAGPRGQAATAAGLLLGYWLLLTRVPAPGGGMPSLDPETSLAARVDRLFLTGHMWKQTKTWDPEGLLSTLPAVATTLLGLLAGEWLRGGRSRDRRASGLLGGGLALALLGLLWHEAFPINKNLWTSSYVLFTAGLAAYLFGLVYWIVDARGHHGWTRPFVVYGRNAIFVFVASGLVAKTLALVKLPGVDGRPVAAQTLVYRSLFAPWASPVNASLAYALANVAAWYLVLLWMERRGLHLKV